MKAGKRSKFVPYPHRQLRIEFRSYLRRKAKAIGTMLAGVLAIGTFVTVVLILAEPHGPVFWYILGAVDAFLMMLGLGMVVVGFLTFSPAALWFLRGALGEDNTKDVLKGLSRRTIWGYVAGISTRGGDIDHLVVTREAGVLAIDSKWRSEATTVDIDQMANAARKAAARAESVLRSRDVAALKRQSHAQHRHPTPSFAVRPVVVVWGAAAVEMPDLVQRGDVAFVAGRYLETWLLGLSLERVDKDAGLDLLARLRVFRDRRAAADRT